MSVYSVCFLSIYNFIICIIISDNHALELTFTLTSKFTLFPTMPY
jgi:hypothetical protein